MFRVSNWKCSVAGGFYDHGIFCKKKKCERRPDKDGMDGQYCTPLTRRDEDYSTSSTGDFSGYWVGCCGLKEAS